MSTITPLPDAPTRADPANFSAKGDALMTALPPFVIETNIVAAEVQAAAATVAAGANAANSTSTSTTSLTVGSGSKSLTVTTGKYYAIGQQLVIAYTATPSNRMIGTVTAFDSGTGALTVDVTVAEGSGTYTSWTISPTIVGSSIGLGGSVVSGSVTLTSTSPAVQKITPTAYGQSVTLPDATTCAKGGPLFVVENVGAYTLSLKDSSGEIVGFVPPNMTVPVGLSDNSTVAGQWSAIGAELIGETANVRQSNMLSTNARAVPLDADRTLFLNVVTASIYATVFNYSTKTAGATVAVRTGMSGGAQLVTCKSATDQVLVVSGAASSTAMETVVLSISGTTVTVNAAVATTLGSAFNTTAFGASPNHGYTATGIVQFGTSFVFTYSRSGASIVRGITISGTVPTLGAEVVLTGPTFCSAPYLATSSTGLVFSYNTAGTLCYCSGFSVAGSTITIGTTINYTQTETGSFYISPLGSRWVHVVSGLATNVANLISLSGTVPTRTQANLFTSGIGAAPSHYNFVEISTTKLLCVASNTALTTLYANILTDSVGTVSAGTQAFVGSTTAIGIAPLQRVGDIVSYGANGTGATYAIAVDCSGASPTVTTRTLPYPSDTTLTVAPIAGAGSTSYALLGVTPGNFSLAKNNRVITFRNSPLNWCVVSHVPSLLPPTSYNAASSFAVVDGDTRRWVGSSLTTYSLLEIAK